MKKYSQIIYVLLITVLFTACSPQINYFGNQYAPTEHVDLFFRPQDVKYEYEVMGVVNNEGDEFEITDSEEVKKAMIKKAKQVGADAVLFSYKEKVSDYTDHHTQGGNTSSHIYHAEFLKYK